MRMSSLAVGAAAFSTAASFAVLGASPATAVAPASDTSSTPMCATSQLTASLGGQDAGAGNLYRYLVLTNHSGTTCHLTGFPGLSLLDASGKQIGAPATREHNGYAAVVLRPGGKVSDTIHTINHQGTCLPTSTSLRIYPPGNKASLVFAGKITNCDNQFSVTPLVAGTGGNPSNSAPAPTPTTTSSGSGSQVTAVPSGAPDTGLAETAHSSGTHDKDTLALAGAGVLAVGALGLVTGMRRRSHGRAQD
ncbi:MULTISPECIES: DUF4232 domain-containing protein [unclassified Streptomyces]|uniref:DUF4232 domain-containing protein n=1 Tax=unclassified Streptomyces TaxID=2593676 RepID=UPI003803DF05